MKEAQAPPGWRLPYDELATAVKGLPGWVLHASGLSMSRELAFASSGPGLLFVQAAGLLARIERRWPEISWARERVWVTLRSFELGLTWRDLELARKLEVLAERCAAATLPEPPLPPGSFADFEELAEVTRLALQALHRELGEGDGSARPGPLRKALDELPAWEPEIDGEGLTSEYSFPSEEEAGSFVGLARELAEREGWRVELLASGRLVGAVVHPSEEQGLTKREVHAVGVLDQLAGRRRPAETAPARAAGDAKSEAPCAEEPG